MAKKRIKTPVPTPVNGVMHLRGLLDVRDHFTPMFKAVEDGNEVHILHVGLDRSCKLGYKLVPMTEADLSAFPPKVKLPSPTVVKQDKW